jgi:hypothetical protein
VAAAAVTALGESDSAPATSILERRPAPQAAATAAKLARLANDVGEHALRFRLDEPDIPGVPAVRGRDPSIAAVTQAVLDSDRAFRAEAAMQLERIAAEDSLLSASGRADVAALRGRLERSSLDRDVLRRFETDPGLTWPRIDGAIRALVAGRPGALCRRLVPATRRLRAIPEALRATQVGLVRPSQLATEIAIRRFARTLALCRRDIPAAVEDCREPVLVADLAEADTLAAGALEDFVTWLGGDVLPHASGSWAMGAETYARWLRATTGDSTPIQALRDRAERELASQPPPDSARKVRAGDSARSGMADSLLEARAQRWGHGTAGWLRTVLGRRELAFAWAAYAERVRGAERAGPAAETPHVAPSRLDLAGMLVEIDLHAQGASIDDARARLMRDAGLDSAAADAEARAAALSPVRAAVVVTAWRLEDVRVEAAARLASRFSPRLFLAAAIDEGAVPVSAIREPLLRRLRAWGRTGPAR